MGGAAASDAEEDESETGPVVGFLEWCEEMIVVIVLGIAAKSDLVIDKWIRWEWKVAGIAKEMMMPASRGPHPSSP